MIKSMTAYSSTIINHKSQKIVIEIKCLNSKNLDLNCKIPKELKDKESSIRKLISNTIQRGKVEFNMYYEKDAEVNSTKINAKIIKQNINGISKISSSRLLDELKKLILSEGFLKISKDKFCQEIISIIFPQLINLNIFKNINEHSKKITEQKNFIFLISLMIIDDSDNSEYFIYKYNISNEDKKRIRFLSNIYSKPFDKGTFKEKKLLSKDIEDYLIELEKFISIRKNEPLADINAVKELLGHANLSATQIYTHNSIEKLKSVHKQAHPKS